MASDDLCYLTATEAIERFRAKTLSPVELMSAVIARSEAANPKVNAYTYTFYERAMEQARAAEQAYASGAETRPLEGVPVLIKDFHAVKGEITTFGSTLFADHVPDFSAPTVERLLDAGGIMHARSTTPEMAHAGHTRSELWGTTRNPWNLEFVPGGSSGGAGAAVAAGMTTLADGTDGGGSIRIPAGCCGIFGFKPPFGRNPTDRDHPRESLLHYGPMTRSVADAALMQNVTAGPHRDDICSIRPKLEIPETLEPIKGWKVAFSMDLGYFEVDEEVQKNTRDALQAFRDLGCTVHEVDVGWTKSVLDAWTVIWEGLFWATFGDQYPALQVRHRRLRARHPGAWLPAQPHALLPHQPGAGRDVPHPRAHPGGTRHPGLPDQRGAGTADRPGSGRHGISHQRQTAHHLQLPRRHVRAVAAPLRLQSGAGMPGRERAERLRLQRGTHGHPDRGPHLRRCLGVPRRGRLRARAALGPPPPAGVMWAV